MCEVFGFRNTSGELNTENILKQTQELIKDKDIVIQLFDARYIYGKDHIISACEHAKRASAENRAHSSTLAMEILLYAAGEGQIKVALTKLGLRKNTSEIAIVAVGELGPENDFIKEITGILNSKSGKIIQDDDVLVGDKETLKDFGITTSELAAIPEDQWFDLVLEKVALVDLKK